MGCIVMIKAETYMELNSQPITARFTFLDFEIATVVVLLNLNRFIKGNPWIKIRNNVEDANSKMQKKKKNADGVRVLFLHIPALTMTTQPL